MNMSNRMTSDEHEEAKQLGNQLVELLTSKSPLVAGFALAAVMKAMPPTVREVFDYARQKIILAMEWNNKRKN